MNLLHRRARVPILSLLAAALVLTALVYQLPTRAGVDVGSGADAPFVQGFSFRENFEGGDLRWSGASAAIRLDGVGAQAGELALRIAVPAQNVGAQVQLNAAPPVALAVGGGWQDIRLALTAADSGPSGDLVVRFSSPTLSAPPDPRALGIQVDRVEFAGAGAPVLPAPRALVLVPALALLALAVGRAWGGRMSLGVAAGALALGGALAGLAVARAQTAYWLAPGLLFGLALALGSYLLVVLLARLTNALGVGPIPARTWRLLFAALTVAFLVRLWLAITPGYIVDVQDYVVWSYKTVTYGLGSMYAAVDGLWISDQSPGLNYVLHGMGLVYRAWFAPDFLYPGVAGDPALRGLTTNPALLADPVQRTLLRLPMLFADLATGALLFALARKWLSDRGAWLVALGYLFNPAVLWNGAWWGQTDAIHTLLVLSCFVLVLYTPRVGLAFFLLGVAAFTKPQAMIFAPLLLLAAYRLPASSAGLLDRAALGRVARAVACGALGAAVMLLPVVLTGGTAGLFAYFGDTIGHHPTLSANAHNLWWLVFHDDVDMPDTAAVFPGAPLSYRSFSILLFALAYLFALVKGWRADRRSYFMLGAFVAFAFFLLPTEIHENYGFALLSLLAVALAANPRLVRLYLLVSLTMTLNYALHDPALYERLGLSEPHAQLAWPRWFNALANVALFAVWGVYAGASGRVPAAAQVATPARARGTS